MNNKTKKTLGLCVIIKDDSELDGLKKLINSFGKYIDEIYITATNNPCKKIKRFCNDSGVKYSWYKWINDFSKARNFNFSQNKCDYGIWADTDDVVINAKKLPKVIEYMEELGANIVYMNYNYAQNKTDGQGIMDHHRPRVYKNDGKCEWKKSVHETLNRDDEQSFYEKDIYFLHTYKDESKYDKELRNYKILLSEYNRDGDKTDPRTLHYLGNSSFGLAMEVKERDELLEQSIHFYSEHIKKSGWDEETYKSYVGIGYGLSILGRQDQAINALMKATQIRPDWDEAYWLLANCYMDNEDYARVVEFGEIAMIKKEPNTPLGINKSLRRFIGPVNLINAYIMTNQVSKASKLFNSINDGSEKFEGLKKIVQDAWETDDYVNKTIDVILYTKKNDKYNVSKLVENLPDYLMQDVRLQELRIKNSKPKTWERKSVVFLCGNSLEEWADPSVIKGIGGSEEGTIYMAREFAKRGYKVTVFNSCGRLKGDYRGVSYRPYWEFNPNDSFDIFIGWRNPAIYSYVIKARTKLLWLHDQPMERDFNKAIIDNVDKIMVLSNFSRKQLPKIPDDKFLITANGLNMIDILAGDTEERNPHRLIWSSSYDRGLDTLLERWPKILKEVADAELFICYGWDNFDKVSTDDQSKKWKAKVEKLMQQKGITHAGRIGQKQLVKEFARSGLWVYPTAFWETSCITAMRAQATGVIPVCSNYGALQDTVKYGYKIDGVTEFMIMPSKVADEIVDKSIELMKDTDKQEEIRKEMIPWAREKFTWSNVCDQWIEVCK